MNNSTDLILNMHRKYLFIITVLLSCFAYTQNTDTDALEIENQYISIMKQEVQSVDSIKEKILNLDKKICLQSLSASQCLNQYLQKVEISTPLAHTAYLKLATAALLKDKEKNREIKSKALLSVSENILLINDRINLKKSWLANYKIKKPADAPFISKVKIDTIKVFYESKKISLKIIDDNIERWDEVMRNPDKSNVIDQKNQTVRMEKIKSNLQRQKYVTFSYD